MHVHKELKHEPSLIITIEPIHISFYRLTQN